MFKKNIYSPRGQQVLLQNDDSTIRPLLTTKDSKRASLSRPVHTQ
ncbi:unnamed protein product [Haemonchus placei]|uniref:Uncharacterized protein n=1 Tax=Haemonchus placei TaxID=6290 RepID=A0A0N4XAX1_HAEPC|nr:unnamed protein product [Haemonchus placei]